MRRFAVAGVGGLIAVVALAAGWYVLSSRTDSTVTPVQVEAAIASLDSSPATLVGAAVVAVLPPPGVYTYATVGGDRIDALGGASHEYPATSIITVRPEGCGVVQLWEAARERAEQFETCVDDDGRGLVLVGWSELHRFFGTDDRQSFRCSGQPRPLGAPPGTTWTTTCRRDGETAVWTGEVLDDTARVAVEGVDRPAEHVVWTIDNGDPNDRQRIETWYLAGTDLVLRRIGFAQTQEQTVIGLVHYDELYDITLESLTPRR